MWKSWSGLQMPPGILPMYPIPVSGWEQRFSVQTEWSIPAAILKIQPMGRRIIFKAVSEGQRSFEAIAIISDSETFTAPCGVCRQVMSEFCSLDFTIFMCNRKKEYQKISLGELLPHAFSL